MRIISGDYKGKRLVAPKKLPVRPTTDMAKEGLFNILSNRYHLQNLKVLDLFAGTGNISFEFASRGTRDIIAVDAFPGCVQFISRTSKELDFSIQSVKSDVFKFLEKVPGTFDIIFADPPYDLQVSQFERIIQTVFQRKMLQPNGTLILEHAAQTQLNYLDHFSEFRKYGGSRFSFFMV